MPEVLGGKSQDNWQTGKLHLLKITNLKKNTDVISDGKQQQNAVMNQGNLCLINYVILSSCIYLYKGS